MTDPGSGKGVPQLMRRIAGMLERVLEGDDLALEALQRELEDGDFEEDDLQTVAAVLRSLAGSGPALEAGTVERAPAADALRVPSAEERQSLSPEAWGFLLDLRGRGSLDSGQFERVLDLLLGSGVRPVDVELAREAAAHVVLDGSPEEGDETLHGEDHLSH